MNSRAFVALILVSCTTMPQTESAGDKSLGRGEPCVRGPYSCEPGLVCGPSRDPHIDICMPPLSEGMACVPFSCALGLSCRPSEGPTSQTCQPPGFGGPCFVPSNENDPQCADGYYCYYDYDNRFEFGGRPAGTCFARAGECVLDVDCAEGFFCEENGSCRPERDCEGNPALCPEGTVCRPMDGAFLYDACLPPGKVGQHCARDASCEPGLHCDGLSCTSGAVGEPCQGDRHCRADEGLICGDGLAGDHVCEYVFAPRCGADLPPCGAGLVCRDYGFEHNLYCLAPKPEAP